MEEKILEIINNHYPVIAGENDFFFDAQKKLAFELAKVIKENYVEKDFIKFWVGIIEVKEHFESDYKYWSDNIKTK